MDNIIKKIENSKIKVAVFGDLMIDHYLIGTTDRISPEAPIPVINVQREEFRVGGAGNVVNNLIALGADVSIFSSIGKDRNGEQLLKLLNSIGADITGIEQIENRKTTIKSRVLSHSQQMIRFDSEDREDIDDEVVDKILTNFKKYILNFDIVLISDYGKGVISESLSQKVISISKSHNLKVIIDPKGEDYSKYKGAFLVKPNRKEAQEAIQNINSIDKIGLELIKRFQFENVIITLSEDGMKLFNQDKKIEHFPTEAREIFDVTGAGDTVLASLGVAIAVGVDLKKSIYFANLASAIVIGKIGTSTVSLNEIANYKTEKVKTWQELKYILSIHQDKKIVFTNGCFDILHIGHVKYLEEAKSFGDILIVGVNSDSSVKRLKGDSRPINGEDDRAYILGSLQSVDYVVKFEEDTPYKLINYLKPNILVKGGDYKDKQVVGAELVDEVRLVNFVEGKSTTKIIEKISCNC